MMNCGICNKLTDKKGKNWYPICETCETRNSINRLREYQRKDLTPSPILTDKRPSGSHILGAFPAVTELSTNDIRNYSFRACIGIPYVGSDLVLALINGTASYKIEDYKIHIEDGVGEYRYLCTLIESNIVDPCPCGCDYSVKVQEKPLKWLGVAISALDKIP